MSSKNIRKRTTASGEVRFNAQVRRGGYRGKSKTFHSEQEAIDWVTDNERDIRERVTRPRAVAARNNVAGMVEAYLAEVKGTHKSYKDTAARCNFFAVRLGSVKLTELTPDMITDALDGLSCSPQTKNRYLGSFSGCITRMSAIHQDRDRSALFVGPNPCKLILRTKEPKGRQRIIKPKEWARLLKYVDAKAATGSDREKQWPAFLRLAYETGRRRGELLSLTWACVDFDEEVIHLLDTKTGDDQIVVMTKPIKKLLKEQRRDFQKEGHPHVFRGRLHNRPTDFDDITREAMRTVFEPDHRGEIPVLHSVRHTAATELGEAGATETEIKSITGHKSSASVSRYVKQTKKVAIAAQAKRSKSKGGK